MNFWPGKNRASEYRERAAEARMKAESLTDARARAIMMQSAETWDRMAAYEEQHPPERLNFHDKRSCLDIQIGHYPPARR
jgi:hypothetical protein